MSENSFTLIELLIVIAILAVLGTAVVLIINPAELLRQSRDSQRLYDLSTINRSLSLMQVDRPTAFFGTSSIVYVSLPDATTTCANLGLPALPTGWQYACAPETNYRKVDGNGWIPVNFTLFSSGSSLAKLPIDPINSTSTGEYYTYTTGGSWHLTAFLTSEKNKMGGNSDKSSKDNGSYPELYELGSNLTLLPISRDPSLVGYWKFDETSGTLYDSSGKGNNGTQYGGVTYGAAGKVGTALSFDGSNDYVNVANSSSITFGASNNFTIATWIKPNPITFYRAVVAKGGQSNAVAGYQFFTWSTGGIMNLRLTWSGGPTGGIDINKSGLNLDDGNWHLVVAVVNRTNNLAYVYADNLSAASANISTVSDTSSATDLTIGYGGAGIYSGFIDDVRIYNRALSASEISAIYNAAQ